jgi:hypothetical protein
LGTLGTWGPWAAAPHANTTGPALGANLTGTVRVLEPQDQIMVGCAVGVLMNSLAASARDLMSYARPNLQNHGCNQVGYTRFSVLLHSIQCILYDCNRYLVFR